MKKYNSFLKVLLLAFTALFFTGCVHDDKYDAPNLDGFQCQDLVATLSIAQVKALHTNVTYVFPDNSTAVMEGYVSSTDETGNIYKTIYIQDSRVNPTQGFTISVDAVSTYTKYPQGSKIYIKLAGLALGTYGGLVQLGIKDSRSIATGVDAVSRIPEKLLPTKMFRSCAPIENIVPKVLKISDFNANNNLLGALIQVSDVEFSKTSLCGNFAPDGFTVDRQIGEGWNTTSNNYTATATVRNSGFASFANQLVPAGNGAFVGIFSKFTTTFQLYINKISDLAEMKNFPRKDGITKNPCELDPSNLTAKTVADVKKLISGNLTQITGDFVLKGIVTANDETGNLFKYIYLEDATGGIRININKTALYQDARFKVGKEISVKLKDLYIGNVSGELQLGALFGSNVGQIAEADVYKTFFDNKKAISTVEATERTITQISPSDVGRWIKIKDVQFIASEIGSSYATGAPSNRNLEDCSGNKIVVRTSNRATFATEEIDDGKGDVYGILSIFNGVYQLWLPQQVNALFNKNRCDGSSPASVIFREDFQNGLDLNWKLIDKAGTQAWTTSNQGTGNNYYAVMNGSGTANEDWLVSKEISLSGFTKYTVSYLTDGSGSNQNPIQVLITDNYTGDPSTTTWTPLTGKIDAVLTGFGFETSNRVDINSFANKKVRVAFKYISTTSGSATWEVDNVQIKGMN